MGKTKIEISDELRAQYLADLREVCEQSNRRLYCTVKHVSKSGMSRVIDVRAFYPILEEGTPARVGSSWLSYKIAAVLGLRFDREREAIFIEGCGMDMCFELVYQLGRTLYPGGDGKTMTGRNWSKTLETDGGYLLNYEAF